MCQQPQPAVMFPHNSQYSPGAEAAKARPAKERPALVQLDVNAGSENIRPGSEPWVVHASPRRQGSIGRRGLASRSPKTPPRCPQQQRRWVPPRPRLSMACLTIVALFWLCFFHTYRLVLHRRVPIDVSMLPRPIGAARLRQLGERSAERFPGHRGMGLHPPDKRAFMPLDPHKAVASCEASGPRLQGGMTVLVTGAAGFIGSAAALELKRQGHGVLGIDNFNDYYPVSLKRARQLMLASHDVYVADGDINDQPLLRRLFQLCRVSHVLHLAAQAGIRYAASNPLSYVHANIAGHVKLLDVIKDQRPMPRVVYASSSSVYGLNKKQPFAEGDRVDEPASLYASTKRADELISHTYFNIHGMSLTGLRFFTVYGPWGRPDMAAYKFAKNILKGDLITVYQGPNSTELSRDFTYIDDVVDGIMAALASSPPSTKGQAAYRMFNIGNTHPHTVSQLVELLQTHLHTAAIRKLVPVPPTGDVLATFADISHARQELQYAPKVSLEEGVKRFCAWFGDYYGLAAARQGKPSTDWDYNPV